MTAASPPGQQPGTSPLVVTASPSGLLRTAGLPIRMWLAAAAPDLFTLVRQLDQADSQYRLLAADLAGRLGAEVVPSPELATTERRWLLAQRRALHQGLPVSSEDYRRLQKLASRTHGRAPAPDVPGGPPGQAGLIGQLEEAELLAAEVALLAQDAADRIEAEKQRLTAAPWELLSESPSGRQILADPALGPMADIAGRVASGEPWTTKRMRRRSDYLWRMIGRGAVKTTPRGWLGHVALVIVRDVPVGPLGPDLLQAELDGQAATEWIDNLHLVRAACRAAPRIEPDSVLSLAPLQREVGDQQEIWVLDPADPTHLTTWQLRRSAEFKAITGALAAGPLRLAELEARAFGPVDDRRCRTVRGLLTRLAEMGVIQAGDPPRQLRQPWQRLATRIRPETGRSGTPGAGYTDVYRHASGGAAVSVADLRDAIEQLLRVRALIKTDEAGLPRPDQPEPIGPRPRPLLDVLAGKLAARRARPDGGTIHPHQHGTWPPARTDESGYARLLAWMAGAADRSPGGPVHITAGLLDALGAPSCLLSWPVDCVIRPLGRGRLVLHDNAPAGVLDARFIEMLEWLHGPVPHAEAYRAFLGELDRSTGIQSVELLTPPVSERAANAVRRPLYASAWTGDSDPASYSSGGRNARLAMNYLPLATLTVRRDGGQLVVECDGRPIRVLSHATRNPLYPWNLVTGILLAGSPQRELRACRLRWSLAAYPDRSFFPRVTAGAGAVVISAAQWIIGPAELWDASAAVTAKLRHLVRLRDRLGLPRWVFAARWPGSRPAPCDLESLRALEVIEEAGAGAHGVLVEEMLPQPAEFGVTDLSGAPGGRVASELMIRLGTAVAAATGHETQTAARHE